MKKLAVLLMAVGLIFSGLGEVGAEKINYEKYGKIALVVVKTDYPGEPLTDYQFLGRKKLNATDVQDTFKFQVKVNGKPINVLVKVTHSVVNEKLVSLTAEQVK